jgi:hypothetical protein
MHGDRQCFLHLARSLVGQHDCYTHWKQYCLTTPITMIKELLVEMARWIISQEHGSVDY